MRVPIKSDWPRDKDNLGCFGDLAPLSRWAGPTPTQALRMDRIEVETYQIDRMATDLRALIARRYPYVRQIVAAQVFLPLAVDAARRAGIGVL